MFASVAARAGLKIRASSARRCPRSAAAAASAGRSAAIHVEAHLESRGIKLPKAIVPPQGNYVVAYQTGKTLYISGHIPMTPEGVLLTGTVGGNISEEDGVAAARLVALNMLATLKCESWDQLGDLDRVARIVKLNGYVQCVDGYTGQPTVVNGASDLLAEAFGQKGIHARSAVGMSSMPLDIPVELEAIVEAV
ncbi:unnamed protein product [Pylaiella littoralis]